SGYGWMSDRKLPRPRAELAQFQPYRTQMLKADVRINANEWPEPNVAGRYITAEELNGVLLNRYPGRGDELREILSARWGTKPDRLVLGNGSNELLLQVFLVFGGHGRRTLLFHLTYSMHGRLTQLAGGTVVEEMIGLPYEVTKERALATMAKVRPEIVVFTTPNNPTGGEIEGDVILELAKRERARVFAALRRVPVIEVFPSVTNFILFRLRNEKPPEVHARFLEQSVLIRDISIWPGCDGCLRASIGTPAENDRFIAALDTVFAAPAARR